MKKVTYDYDHLGYRVFVDGVEEYSAGNHRRDSTVVVDPPDASSLSVAEILHIAVGMAKEIAEEVGGEYCGRNDD